MAKQKAGYSISVLERRMRKMTGNSGLSILARCIEGTDVYLIGITGTGEDGTEERYFECGQYSDYAQFKNLTELSVWLDGIVSHKDDFERLCKFGHPLLTREAREALTESELTALSRKLGRVGYSVGQNVKNATVRMRTWARGGYTVKYMSVNGRAGELEVFTTVRNMNEVENFLTNVIGD